MCLSYVWINIISKENVKLKGILSSMRISAGSSELSLLMQHLHDKHV